MFQIIDMVYPENLTIKLKVKGKLNKYQDLESN